MVFRWGEKEIIYLSLHYHHQNYFCVKIGSDESHFNVSVGSDGLSHKTVSTNHNLFEEKGEPKRYRTEVLPLTSLTARPNRLTICRIHEKFVISPRRPKEKRLCPTLAEPETDIRSSVFDSQPFFLFFFVPGVAGWGGVVGRLLG